MKFVLIGKGNWGEKLLLNLKKIGRVEYIITSKDSFKNLDLSSIKWAFVASPNKFHYSQVKFFLKKKINVFCEKPLALSYKKSLELIKFSKKCKTKLYIDDIEYFKHIQFDIKSYNYIYRSKFSNKSFKENLYALAYHDFYLLDKHLKIRDLKIKIFSKKKPNYYFKIISGNKSFFFKYELNKKPLHFINAKSFKSHKNFINIMLIKVLRSKKSFFDSNHKRSLKANYVIDLIKNK